MSKSDAWTKSAAISQYSTPSSYHGFFSFRYSEIWWLKAIAQCRYSTDWIAFQSCLISLTFFFISAVYMVLEYSVESIFYRTHVTRKSSDALPLIKTKYPSYHLMAFSKAQLHFDTSEAGKFCTSTAYVRQGTQFEYRSHIITSSLGRVCALWLELNEL